MTHPSAAAPSRDVVAEAVAANPSDEALIRGYFTHVPAADLPQDVGLINRTAQAHRKLGAQRPAGTAKLRIYQPRAGEDGWGGTSTAFDIVTDDMPYLVDAVLHVLADLDLRVQRVFHPIMASERDADGNLLGWIPRAEGAVDSESAIAESWMHLLIDRVTDEDRLAALETALLGALSDVRSVVSDTPAMVAAARGVAATVAQSGAENASEVAKLLEWFTQGNALQLAYRREADVEPASNETTSNDAASTDTTSDDALGLLRAESARAVDDLITKMPVVNPDGIMGIAQLWQASAIAAASPTLSVTVRTDGTPGGIRHRFLINLTRQARNSDIKTVPILRQRVDSLLSKLRFAPDSHSGQHAISIVAGYPRSELFWADSEQVMQVVSDQLHTSDQHRLRVFVQPDPRGHFISVLVYLPRDRYTTETRLAMQRVLSDDFAGREVRYEARIGDSTLATVHFTVFTEAGNLPDVDMAELTDQLRAAVRTWEDQIVDVDLGAEFRSAEVRAQYAAAFDEAYKEDYPASAAVDDLAKLDGLQGSDDLALSINESRPGAAGDHRLKLYVSGAEVSLSQIMPMLQSMGLGVIDERPYDVVRSDGTAAHIYDFGIATTASTTASPADLNGRFVGAFSALWRGDAEVDGFNALVLTAGLSWQQISIIRAYAKYLQQMGTTYTQGYIEQVLNSHPVATKHISELFAIRFDPALGEAERETQDASMRESLAAELDAVSSLDADRILRSYLHLIEATDRTNAYQLGDDDQPPATLAFKLDPHRIPGSPKPVPAHEIWVYSPRVEGTHLRFGKVARGGLRWSNRPEDFRTEVLGLVKAQEVKNAVIVPVGAKGGFVVKCAPAPTGDSNADRDALQAEGIASYRAFISAMLDITDNRIAGELVHPRDVVRHDDDDAYLVVAADKGTARFSDIANDVSRSYNFWLDDAFASGGSAGYDHKDMGITARGAWESVKHHFRELGVDCQETDFTAVGIGDMSGDVFGNGMLRSEHTKLVAAFDHRDIFIDPSPADPAATFVERQRLYDLPRSSWADYRLELISSGGGVWSRSAKSVPVSVQAREVLGLADDVTELAPTELIRAILRAPVDLVYNGGIGTYIKSSEETDAEVGDKANDPVRVNGGELRAKIVGEGGNLGVTQLGRIEFAKTGGKINTDAIDNSAGVDASDHEVNIKIGLAPLMADGRLPEPARNELLHAMTDDVAELVLADNKAQNRLLGVSRFSSASMLPVYRRQISALTAEGSLDRDIEYLPTDEEIVQRLAVGRDLRSPELAVLIAYTKSKLTSEMLTSDLPESPAYAQHLPSYFPSLMQQQHAEAIETHPLAREIVTTMTANQVVNYAGITYAFRLGEEIAASPTDAIRAYTVVDEVFNLRELFGQVDAADHVVPGECQDRLTVSIRRLLDRAARWFLSRRPQPLDVTAEISRYRAPVQSLTPSVKELLQGVERENVDSDIARFVADGATPELAELIVHNLYRFSLLDITDVAEETGADLLEAARMYFALSAHLDFDHLLTQVSNLTRGDRWHALARQAVRDDLYQSMAKITADVLAVGETNADADAKIAQWEDENASRLTRSRATLSQIADVGAGDLAALSVAARELRAMIR